MANDKYQQMMYEKIQQQFQDWDSKSFIIERDLYGFLHSLKGTAGSIGMTELSAIAAEKLDVIEAENEQYWDSESWHNFLAPIVEALSFFETNYTSQQSEDVEASQLPMKHQDFIVVIDDDTVFMSYMKNVLEKSGFLVLVANNGERGLKLIYEFNPALVFLDIMLPDTNGFSILENITKIKANQMYVAVMSVNDSRENRKKAYDLGAFDFIAKPIDEEILVSYVHNRLNYKRMLEHSIVTDELTQVYNRKYFDQQMKRCLQNYQYKQEPFTVAMTDLDFFKKVNDTYGHLIGDDVLKGFAGLVMSEKREDDIFCRYGGEEFVMLLPNTNADEAYKEMERLRVLLSQKVFFSEQKKPFNVTYSSGIAQVNADHAHPKKLLELADRALYEAKKTGRNRTVVYTDAQVIEEPKKGIKIIVIDDVYIIRNLIMTGFNQLTVDGDYTVEVAAYSDGLSFLNDAWYDPNYKYILLLDGMMPQMDGIDVLRKVREKYSSNEVIVSMLTGRIGENYVREALENGADDYIVKPFNIADVRLRLMNLVNRLFSKVH
ncbi:MAG: diguanylate cyclase [Solibacillus sp.]